MDMVSKKQRLVKGLLTKDVREAMSKQNSSGLSKGKCWDALGCTELGSQLQNKWLAIQGGDGKKFRKNSGSLEFPTEGCCEDPVNKCIYGRDCWMSGYYGNQEKMS